MTVQVKICGLSTADTMKCALDAGADFVGLVFYPPSPRCIETGTAAQLAAMARGQARTVALTVDADDDLLDRIVEGVDPDLIQAQGSEPPERIAEISRRWGKPVIKAVKVAVAADVQQAAAYAGTAHMVLFDAKAPDALANALPGGNGMAFDWTLLSPDGAPARFMLAGGLTADNVAEAIRLTGAPIVDVSSAVEVAPGRKDCRLIRNFIEAAKSAR